VIVRILGEGQLDLSEEALERVNALDEQLDAAVRADDEEAFRSALTALLDGVRAEGRPHRLESLDESDVILPAADTSLAEVREMLGDDGLIPG